MQNKDKFLTAKEAWKAYREYCNNDCQHCPMMYNGRISCIVAWLYADDNKTIKRLENNMKLWVLKNKFGEYLCNVGYFSHDLVAPDNNDYVNGEIIRTERKCDLTEIMKDFNKDIKPEYKVSPVQVEVQIKVTEIKKEIK